MDDGVEENESGEEAGMEEREVDEGGGAEGMSDTDEGEGHFGPEVVDHVEQVAGMVVP